MLAQLHHSEKQPVFICDLDLLSEPCKWAWTHYIRDCASDSSYEIPFSCDEQSQLSLLAAYGAA